MKDTLTNSLYNTANNNKDIINYRLELLKYLDQTTYADDEFLFFNMLNYTRFINVNDTKTIAYTKRNKLIYLNAPTPILGDEF